MAQVGPGRRPLPVKTLGSERNSSSLYDGQIATWQEMFLVEIRYYSASE